MHTLTVADIFKNLAFYQAQYQSILHHPEQYQILVQDAVLDIWPITTKKLYLGDLLQLWFSQKWLININYTYLQDKTLFPQLFNSKIQKEDLYLCEIYGNVILGISHAKVWSLSEQRLFDVVLEGSLQYYCSYKTIKTI